LNKFKVQLESRSSLKRYQKGQAFYSLWSTGEYTFSPFKVLWREIGKTFAAAYVGSSLTNFVGTKIVIPDHKLYFIPVETEAEAAYLVGFLNAPIISRSVSAYSSQLSLGVSVAKYIRIPRFDEKNQVHISISEISYRLTKNPELITDADMIMLNEQVKILLKIA
jgi:hypothetical protein